jgi:hypothetical protein
MDELKKSLWNRREFTNTTLMALLAGVTVTVSGCDSDSPTAPTQTPAPPAGPNLNGAIGSNHGHTAVISQGQVNAGAGFTLDIRGTATHPHNVTISMGELAQIVAGQRVIKDSTVDDAHSHSVTFN